MTRPEVLVPVNLYVSCVVQASAEDVWEIVGRFDGLGAINPRCSCEMEDGAHHKQVGAVRVVHIEGMDGFLREYLLALSDEKPCPSMTYSFHLPRPGEKSLVPLPRYDTVNTTSVRPITMSKPSSTLVEATSKFLAEPQNAAELKEHTEGFFVRFFGMIQHKFAQKD